MIRKHLLDIRKDRILTKKVFGGKISSSFVKGKFVTFIKDPELVLINVNCCR